jgi:hypothetical protein
VDLDLQGDVMVGVCLFHYMMRGRTEMAVGRVDML